MKNKKQKPIKLFEEYHSDNNSTIAEHIQELLLEEFDYDTWGDFLDDQELGECQSIVSSIKFFNIPGVEPIFGEIKIIDPYIPQDDDIEMKGKKGKIMTHHWVKINGEIYEFSKGTLKDYVDWMVYEDVEAEDSIEYINEIRIEVK